MMQESSASLAPSSIARRATVEAASSDLDEPRGATRSDADRRPPRRRWRRLVIVLAVLAVVGWLTVRRIDRAGWRFFETGAEITEVGRAVADALVAGDFDALTAQLADDYRGARLGLVDPRLAEDRDGVRVYPFAGGETGLDRAAAVAEWRAYREGMAEVEEAGLFLHRLDRWAGDEIRARLRFEMIATPHGEPRPGIDRAYLDATLARVGDTMKVRALTMLEGDRVIAATPHFVDVAEQAGVAFENQYYPRFFTENLRFGMLRYGPAGIAAVDYDDDGWYDLFVPDGVRSRLFRNLGPGPDGDVRFAETTDQIGLGGLDGVGVAVFADWDNDGDKDAFVSRTFEPNQLFRNDGGTFVDVTAASGIGADCCTTVASWGDVDNDGLLDLYVGRYLDPRTKIPTTFYARNGEPNQLYRNNGDGTFTNITETAGVGELGLCLGSVFGDYDDDGDADLYVVNDFGRKTLYRNDGPGADGIPRFRDVTVETGTLAYGAGMSASFGDYDNDRRLDIYVAHIRSEEGWFAATPTVMRYMLNTWRQGVWKTDMPLYWEIFRQSGFGFVGVFQDMASGNTLLRNRGDGTFEDTTWQAGANPPGWFWGSGFVDFDNDGWQDLYSANGWVYNDRDTEIELEFLNNVVSEMREYKTGAFFDPANFGNLSWHGWERNRHLRSDGRGPDGQVRFREIGRATGTDLLLNSRGIAVADFTNRGVLDIAVAASTDRHALLRNDVGLARDWLAVELVGAAGARANGTNRDGVGARITVRTAAGEQIREVASGDGYGSQNSLRQYFGLGGRRDDGAPVVEEITVFWPRSGDTQRFSAVPGNRIVVVREGADALAERTPTAGSATGDDERGSMP